MARSCAFSEPNLALQQLRDWYVTPLGRALAQEEQAMLREFLPNLFGYHLLTIDAPYPMEALESSRIAHKLMQSCLPCSGLPTCGLEGEAERLPIRTDSLDAVLLPHSLELSRDPHELLREVDRCLVPEGHVVFLGFNPIGIWGAWGLAARWRCKIPWHLRFISMSRLTDWLSLLGFDTLHVKPLFRRPPLQSERALERLAFLEKVRVMQASPLAGGYCLVARKRVTTLTPIRPRWRPRRGILGAGVIEPSNRSYRNRG